MAQPKYLLIESRSSWESREVDEFIEMAEQLIQEGRAVHLYLIQNGVINALKRNDSDLLRKIVQLEGLKIWADDFSLTNRKLRDRSLLEGVQPVGMDYLVTLLTEKKTIAVWH